MQLPIGNSRTWWSLGSAIASIAAGLLLVVMLTREQSEPFVSEFEVTEETPALVYPSSEFAENYVAAKQPLSRPLPIPTWRVDLPAERRAPQQEQAKEFVSTFAPRPDSGPPEGSEIRVLPDDDNDLLIDEKEESERIRALLVPDNNDFQGPTPPVETQPPPELQSAPPTSMPTEQLPPGPRQHYSQPEESFLQPPAQPEAPAIHGPTLPDPHFALFAKNCYPSARDCAVCHQQHFEEWSVSSHGYATVSPMFHKFEQKLQELAQGTVGYFCLRCHSPVGTSMGVPRDAAIWEMPLVAREGVTCIACHRINQNYGKVNGERRIVPGPITDPIYGPINGDGVAQAIAQKDNFKVKTVDDNSPGQLIHSEGRFFEQITRSEFCASCHQVQVHPGIKLEVVYEQYRASPAWKKGIQCQDCHMGRVPGRPDGFDCGAIAIMNGKAVNTERRHTHHSFHGPGYSIAHPGIYPHNVKADRWSPDQWLLFDWRAGWGTEAFEDLVAAGQIQINFPPLWKEVDDRMDAREVLDANLKLLDFKKQDRLQVMENGSRLDGPFLDTRPRRGQDLKFHFIFRNTHEGHNLLTGSLGAQPQLWINVALVDPRGCTVWESGYTDSYGDVADIHSEDVRHKRLPFDSQLFNLQTMFLITSVKGADREFPLPVNVDFDQLPYIRPGAQPISVLNHPPFIRMEAHSVAPLGSRKAPYHVPAAAMQQPGMYRLSVRMRSRVEPIYFMRFCETTVEQQRAMNEGMLDFHQHSVTFEVR